jgi:hypothetical protein
MGLSVGGKAGIAIGSVAGVCIVALLAHIAALLRRRHVRSDAAGGFRVVEAEHKMPELGAGLAHEMEASENVGELETGKAFQMYLGPNDEGGKRTLQDSAEVG